MKKKNDEEGIWPVPGEYRVQPKPLKGVLPILLFLGVAYILRDLDLGKTATWIILVILGIITWFIVDLRVNGNGPKD